MSLRKGDKELEQEILKLTDHLIESAIATSMLENEAKEEQFLQASNIVRQMGELLTQYLGGHEEHLETLLKQLAKQKLPEENILGSFGDFNTNLDKMIAQGLEMFLRRNENSEDILGISQANQTEIEEPLLSDEKLGDNETMAMNESESEMENILTENAPSAKNETESAGEDDNLHDESNYSSQLERKQLSGNIPEITDFTTEEPKQGISVDSKKEDLLELALKQAFPGKRIIKNFDLNGFNLPYYLPELSFAIENRLSNKVEKVWKEYHCRRENIRLLYLPLTKAGHYRQLARMLRRYLAEY